MNGFGGIFRFTAGSWNGIKGRLIPFVFEHSDGGGRSGVYMAIDANLELAEEEDCFHVFGYLKKIRQSRRGLIENVVGYPVCIFEFHIREPFLVSFMYSNVSRISSCTLSLSQDQYKFVYDTLEEHIVCGKTWFSVSELSERLKAKARKNPITKMNHYQEEYAQICKQTPRYILMLGHPHIDLINGLWLASSKLQYNTREYYDCILMLFQSPINSLVAVLRFAN